MINSAHKLQFRTFWFHYKLFVTEKRSYINKLKFTIFYRFCCQYPLTNYLGYDLPRMRNNVRECTAFKEFHYYPKFIFNQKTIVHFHYVWMVIVSHNDNLKENCKKKCKIYHKTIIQCSFCKDLRTRVVLRSGPPPCKVNYTLF